MTISNLDIVTILRKRIDQCRCLGAVPATRCCGGCEHDIRCLSEIVEVRRERDEARREVCLEASTDASGCYISDRHILVAENRGWDCFKNQVDNAH